MSRYQRFTLRLLPYSGRLSYVKELIEHLREYKVSCKGEKNYFPSQFEMGPRIERYKIMKNKTWAPCPSCQGHHLHVAEWYDDDGGTTYYVVCDDCGYEDPDKLEEEYVAVDHWNRRVVKGYVDGDDPTETRYDKLEEDDFIERGNNSVVDDISWVGPGMHIMEPEDDKMLY